jgi:hypothetical protein
MKLRTVLLGLVPRSPVLFRDLKQMQCSTAGHEAVLLVAGRTPQSSRMEILFAQLTTSMRKSNLWHVGELQIAQLEGYQVKSHPGSRKLTVKKLQEGPAERKADSHRQSCQVGANEP